MICASYFAAYLFFHTAGLVQLNPINPPFPYTHTQRKQVNEYQAAQKIQLSVSEAWIKGLSQSYENKIRGTCFYLRTSRQPTHQETSTPLYALWITVCGSLDHETLKMLNNKRG